MNKTAEIENTLSIEETREWMLVWNLYQLPEIEDRVTDDQWNNMSSIGRRYHVMKAIEEKKNHTLLVLRDRDCLGCFLLVWTHEKGREPFHMVHTMLTRGCRGADAITAGKLGIAKAFNIEGVEHLESWCPSHNPESYLFARLCGFKKTGFAPVEWVKNMQRFPIRVVSLSRQNWLGSILEKKEVMCR